jgi:hypothetical protein
VRRPEQLRAIPACRVLCTGLASGHILRSLYRFWSMMYRA